MSEDVDEYSQTHAAPENAEDPEEEETQECPVCYHLRWIAAIVAAIALVIGVLMFQSESHRYSTALRADRLRMAEVEQLAKERETARLQLAKERETARLDGNEKHKAELDLRARRVGAMIELCKWLAERSPSKTYGCQIPQ
jgi:hypothetical protein